MTISSQQPDYLTISNSTDTDIAIPDLDSISIDMSSSITLPTYNYGIGSLNSDTITVSNININWDSLNQTEFVNCFPNWNKIEEMRKEYPGLDIALKKFQEVYKMVEDDWQVKKGQKYVP